MTPAEQQRCREAFEHIATRMGYHIARREDEKYVSSHTQIMWEAAHGVWQAQEERTQKLVEALREGHECIKARMADLELLAECDQAYMVQTEAAIRAALAAHTAIQPEGEQGD